MICRARSKEEVQYVLFDGTQESAIDVSRLLDNRVCEYIVHYDVAGISIVPPFFGEPTITMKIKYGDK